MGQTVNLSGSTLSVSGSWCHQKANGIAPNVPRDTGNKKVESVRFTSVIFTDRNQINSERNSLFVSLYREAFKKKCDKCQRGGRVGAGPCHKKGQWFFITLMGGVTFYTFYGFF